MDEDERCCGTGTCMINADGVCWCGQQWNGTTLCQSTTSEATVSPSATLEEDAAQGDRP